ncbi:MAG: ATP-dependent Clp protease proteolytic subunit [Sphingobacteriales bacterium]|nr:ATP-dependent Clp protease proteolytic subunit [Sphingobacteriales bacterium]
MIPDKHLRKSGKDSDRDYWMRSDEAKEYGMIGIKGLERAKIS